VQNSQHVELFSAAHPAEPVLDLAVSHALLLQVARGERPPAIRLYEPARTVALGRLDVLRPAHRQAAAAARELGFTPLVRLGGGHAAAYGPGSLVYEEIVDDGRVDRMHERFRRVASGLAETLNGLGAPVSVGHLPREYCPGAHSLIAAGTVKIGGLAQRIVRGGALCSTAIVIAGGPEVRAVLTAVYEALAIDWDPATAGGLAEVSAAVGLERARAAIAARRGTPADLDPATLALARELVGRHRVALDGP
jgi:lipoate-protein ligase A